jgi:hypothetical protein
MRETLALRGGAPVVPKQLHVRWPVITAEDKAAVQAALDSGIVSGPYAAQVKALEEEWARYCDVRHALTTNSGGGSAPPWRREDRHGDRSSHRLHLPGDRAGVLQNNAARLGDVDPGHTTST